MLFTGCGRVHNHMPFDPQGGNIHCAVFENKLIVNFIQLQNVKH